MNFYRKNILAIKKYRIHSSIHNSSSFSQSPPGWIPTRAIICVMMFTACWTSYNCRLQMPILAVPMIIADPSDQPSSGACVPGEASGGGGGGGSAPAGLWKSPDNLLHDIMRDEFRQTSKAQSPDGPLQDILPDELHMPGRFKRQDDAAAPSKNDKRKATEMFTGKPFDWSPEIRGSLPPFGSV